MQITKVTENFRVFGANNLGRIVKVGGKMGWVAYNFYRPAEAIRLPSPNVAGIEDLLKQNFPNA